MAASNNIDCLLENFETKISLIRTIIFCSIIWSDCIIWVLCIVAMKFFKQLDVAGFLLVLYRLILSFVSPEALLTVKKMQQNKYTFNRLLDRIPFNILVNFWYIIQYVLYKQTHSFTCVTNISWVSIKFFGELLLLLVEQHNVYDGLPAG